MFEFRVTKYDPAHRDHYGAYTREEWTSVRDIGHVFSEMAFTEPEYRRVEDAYVTAAVTFLREAGLQSLEICGLESHSVAPLPFAEGSSIGLADIADIVRQVLRENFWCRLEGAEGFVHFGYDYYMYVGVPVGCPNAAALAGQLGLFVEPVQSPYTKERRPSFPPLTNFSKGGWDRFE